MNKKQGLDKVNVPAVIEVPNVLDKLNQKIKGMEKIADSVYKTNGKPVIGGQTFDIKVATDKKELVKAYAVLKHKKTSYDDAQFELGIGAIEPFTEQGSTLDEWKDDIKLRINIIEQEGTLKKLNEYKEKFSKFLSEEDQKSILMKEMAAFLQEG